MGSGCKTAALKDKKHRVVEEAGEQFSFGTIGRAKICYEIQGVEGIGPDTETSNQTENDLT